MSDNIRESNTDDHGLWSVHRQDDNGNRFVVHIGMSHDDAAQFAAELEARAHKQLYWIERETKESPLPPS